MLAIILSWIVISIVFLSFGDFFISFYNYVCKRKEEYSAIDTFLIGICLTTVALSISSIWLPSNQYILGAYLILCIGYWIIRRKRLSVLGRTLKERLRSFTPLQLALIILPVIGLIIATGWEAGVYDSLYYHQQNIRWNEEFSVVPGLANLEDRYGFNSSYMLLSALFSLRFIFGEAIYALQALLAVYILCWIMIEVMKSKYEIKRVALLFVYMSFMFTYSYVMTSTSTDAIPSFVSFYLVAKLLLYPNLIKEKKLMMIAIPVLMVTFKLTIIPFCLLSLYILYLVFKEKDYRTFAFFLTTGIIIILPWVIRNVLISGYLIYPFHEIDIFSFDWKVPKEVALQERAFITKCGVDVLNMLVASFSHPRFTLSSMQEIGIGISLFTFVFISPLAIIFGLIRRKNLDKSIYFIYAILVCVILVWYMGGPDPRFIGGCLFVTIFIVLFILLDAIKKAHWKWLGIGVVLLTSGLLTAWGFIRTSNYCFLLNQEGKLGETYSMKDILYRPFSHRRQLTIWGYDTNNYTPYQLNNGVTIYMSRSRNLDISRVVTFDVLPSTVYRSDEPSKYQDISTIEARGNKLQDGFRVKEQYR